MSKKLVALSESAFQIQTINDKTGKIEEQTFNAELALNTQQIGTAIKAAVSKQASMRLAWLSFLAFVLDRPKMDAYKGTGDKVEGKLSKEMKASMRDAEALAVLELVELGHLKIDKGEQALQQFLSTLREDKNYSNAKNLAQRYFAFVGNNLRTPSGHLVPAPVMQQAIADVLTPVEKDKSFNAQLKAIEQAMMEKAFDADDAIECLVVLRRMVEAVQASVTEYAELATAQRVQSTETLAAQAMEAAKAAPETAEI